MADRSGDGTRERLVAGKGKFVAESQILETPEGQAIVIVKRWANRELIPMFGPQTAMNGLLGAGIGIAMALGATNQEISAALTSMAVDLLDERKGDAG